MAYRYSEQFKATVVAFALVSGEPRRWIASEVGISPTTLYRWIREFQAGDGERERTLHAAHAELARQWENERLLEEQCDHLRLSAGRHVRQEAGPLGSRASGPWCAGRRMQR